MQVIEAINNRWSCRAFLPKVVEKTLIESILMAARQAPSGVNHQPWHVAVLQGTVKTKMSEAIIAARQGGQKAKPDYDYYSPVIKEPYVSRRKACGIALYQAQGIARDDKARREQVWEDNYRFFNAPVGLIFYLDAYLATGSWLDLGMFIQNIMLAAQAFGLATCPQAALAEYPDIVRAHVGIEKTYHIACGMALGYPDLKAPVNGYRTEREPLENFVTWHGG